MNNLKSILFIGTAFFSAASFAGNVLPSTPALVEKGKTLYTVNCAACHGEKGDGNGPAGKMMNPKPRSFADPATVFKNGDSPQKIFETINTGLPGTAMAGFSRLTDEEKSALSYYVIKLKTGK